VVGFELMRDQTPDLVQQSSSAGLPFDTAAARQAGRINADLERSGRTIGMPDVMISGIALHSQLPLVTGNTAHFEYIRAVGYDLVSSS
jgi:predicted nucleic acid-binding protein